MAQRKSFFGWFVIIVLIAGAGGGFWWWRTQGQAAAPIDYRTGAVSRGDIVQAVTANGQLTPLINVDVGSQVSGNILKLYADFNSKVTNGQLVAELDAATYEARVVQAEAELANSRAQNNLAKLNARRAKELLENKLTPQSEYDQTMAALEQSEASMRIREAALKSAQVDLSRTKIYSPIDGTVISRNINVGQTVQASFSAPTLFQVANDLTRMQIGALVSEADIGGVEEKQTVNFTVEAFPSRTFRGVVSQVRNQPTTNQNVVTYATMIDVHNEDSKLKPGMTANVSIITSKKEKVIRVSNAALRFRPPTGAVIFGATNAPAAAEAPKAEIATSGPFAGLPVPPWQAGGERRRPTDAERSAYESTLTAEQKAKYQQVVAEMRARFAQGGGGGGGEGRGGGSGGGDRPRRTEPEGPRNQTIYLLMKEPDASGTPKTMLKPVTVKLGISDGTNTEVIDGLKEGDVVAIGTVSAPASASAPVANPFAGPFGGGGPRR